MDGASALSIGRRARGASRANPHPTTRVSQPHEHHGHPSHKGSASDRPNHADAGRVKDVPPDKHAAHAGHGGDRHAGHSVAMFRDRFWVTLALTIPTLVWGHMLPRAFAYSTPHFPGSMWIPPVFGALARASRSPHCANASCDCGPIRASSTVSTPGSS